MRSTRSQSLIRMSALTVLSLVVAACGGGGGGGANSTPTPQSSPSPTPTPNYVSLSTLAQPTTFTAQLARVDFRAQSNAVEILNYSMTDFDSRVGSITYDRSNGSYTVKTSVGEKTFTSNDLGNRPEFTSQFYINDPEVEVYAAPIPPSGSVDFYEDDRLIVFKTIVDVPSKTAPNYTDQVELSYTRIAEWLHLEQTMKPGDAPNNNVLSQRSFAVFGVETTTADMPRSGQADYVAEVQGVYARGGSYDTGTPPEVVDLYGSATFSADFGAGTVQTQIEIHKWATTNGDFSFGTLAGAGTIGAANNFSGQLNGSNGAEGYTGSYSGGFFGPGAQEVGYVFSASSGDSRVVGAAAGTKR